MDGAQTHQHSIAIGMDRRSRALDNIFVERLRRSVKHENVYVYYVSHYINEVSGD